MIPNESLWPLEYYNYLFPTSSHFSNNNNSPDRAMDVHEVRMRTLMPDLWPTCLTLKIAQKNIALLKFCSELAKSLLLQSIMSSALWQVSCYNSPEKWRRKAAFKRIKKSARCGKRSLNITSHDRLFNFFQEFHSTALCREPNTLHFTALGL